MMLNKGEQDFIVNVIVRGLLHILYLTNSVCSSVSDISQDALVHYRST